MFVELSYKLFLFCLCIFIDFVLFKLARRFGYKKSPPSFMDLEKLQYSFKHNIMLGVNFASGGSGILRYTGYKQWVIASIIIIIICNET